MPGEVTGNTPFGGPGEAFLRDALCFGSLLERLFTRVLGDAAHRKGLCAMPPSAAGPWALQGPGDGCSLEPRRESSTGKVNLGQRTEDQVFTGCRHTGADGEVKVWLGAEWQ